MVVNVGKVIGEDWDYVARDIQAVLDVARQHKAILKVIFENDFLPATNLKIKLCEICGRLGVDFVKTSTGFGFVKQPDGNYNYKGATEADVVLMRKHSPAKVGIKGRRRCANAGGRITDARTRLHAAGHEAEPIIGGGKSSGAGY